MFYEYALEPGAVASWESARYFLDAFGPWKGRFLAEFPGHWVRLLLTGLTCHEMEKKRITVRLELAKKNRVFYRRSSPYDGTRSWVDNARQEHARKAFRAIIACTAGTEDYVLEASNLDESNPRWQVDSGRLLSRDPAVFVQALQLLLVASSQVEIIDPYFRADQPDKTGLLTAFCSVIKNRIGEVRVHFSDKDLSYAMLMQHAERALPSCVPTGMRVLLHCWKERTGGPRLHNRYLLTDVGGVQFGDSIERGDPGQSDRVSILEEVTRTRLWNEFVGPTPTFDLVGPVKRVAGRKAV